MSGATWRRAIAAAAAVLATGGLLVPVSAPARTDNRSKPVIFLHGYQGDSTADCRQWNDMTSAFRDWGHTGAFTRLRYYDGDTICDHNVLHHGSHSNHYASGHTADGGHTNETNIRHLGYHLAWYIRSHYSSDGRYVDVVAHSMGGLIARYAIAQSQNGHEDFPANVRVEDIVTLGTPHGGGRWNAFCPSCNTQVEQMTAGSDFLVWLENNAWEPDGEGGTDWSTFGSDDDNWVAADRAAATASDRDPVNVYMGSCHKVWYTGANDIEHSDFLHDTSDNVSADVYRRNCPDAFVFDSTSHWPVRRADLAITFGNR
jgi:pimeloyl-ACP methyl ester carboxylesterase